MANETKYLKCPCAHCGGHIEFPADAAGLALACPHCGQQTVLTVPLVSVPSLAGTETILAGRKVLWFTVAGVLLILGLLAGLAVLQKFKDRLEAKRQATSVPQ